VSLCEHVLQNSSFFTPNETKSAQSSQTEKLPTNADCLFDIYRPEHERYFLKRAIDVKAGNTLRSRGVWMSGPSGCGKTCSLQRAIYNTKRPFCFIDLSKCAGQPLTALYTCILVDIFTFLGGNPSEGLPTGDPIHALCTMLARTEKDFIVMIDEIPLENESELGSFIDTIFGSIIHTHNSKSKNRVTFVMASLKDPERFIKSFNSKVKQHLAFIIETLWTKTDLVRLLKPLAKNLGLRFKSDEINLLLEKANGSPRNLKTILRIFWNHREEGWTLEKSAAEAPIDL
jgi:hypothetical protein